MLIKLDTHEYPVSEQDFINRYPDISFPTAIPYEDFGYAVVFPTPQPATDWYHLAREIAPVLTDKGHWEQQWEVIEVTRTQEEIEEKQTSDIMAKLADIEAKYAPKIVALQIALTSATLTDGAVMESTIANLRQEWTTLLNEKSAEMDAVLA